MIAYNGTYGAFPWASYGDTNGFLKSHWESGQGICRAILNARHEPILAMAMIAGVLVVADGPFLQKASSVKSEFQNTTVTLNFPVAPELPTGFSGIFSENGLETSMYILMMMLLLLPPDSHS